MQSIVAVVVIFLSYFLKLIGTQPMTIFFLCFFRVCTDVFAVHLSDLGPM